MAVAVGADNRLFSRDALHRMVEDDIGRALFQRLGREIVAVEALTGESYKDAAGADLAAVGGHEAMGWLSAKPSGRAISKAGLLRFFHNKSPYPQVMVTIVIFWTLEPAAPALAPHLHRRCCRPPPDSPGRRRSASGGQSRHLTADVRHFRVAAGIGIGKDRWACAGHRCARVGYW